MKIKLVLGLIFLIFGGINLLLFLWLIPMTNDTGFLVVFSIFFLIPIGYILALVDSEPKIKGILLIGLGVPISIFTLYILVFTITHIGLLIALITTFILLWTGLFILPGTVLIIKREMKFHYALLSLSIFLFNFWFLVIMGAGASITKMEYRSFFFQYLGLVFSLSFIITFISIALGCLFSWINS